MLRHFFIAITGVICSPQMLEAGQTATTQQLTEHRKVSRMGSAPEVQDKELLLAQKAQQGTVRMQVTPAGRLGTGRTSFLQVATSPPSAAFGSPPPIGLGASSRGGAGGSTPEPGIEQMPGFPLAMPSSSGMAPIRGVALGDLDNNGTREIVASSTDGNLYAWDYMGNPMPGFPVSIHAFGRTTPTVVDLDNDGEKEIVLVSRGLYSTGRLYVFSSQGVIRAGFPRTYFNEVFEGSPIVYDLDDDGQLEIILLSSNSNDGHLHIIENDGTSWSEGFPMSTYSQPTGSPAVGDIDGDGELEIAFVTRHAVWIVELDGQALPGFPYVTVGNEHSESSPALADLDGDGDLEILYSVSNGQRGVHALHHNAQTVAGWPFTTSNKSVCPPTVAKLERFGRPMILCGHEGSLVGGPSDAFWAIDPDGNAASGFPYVAEFGGGSGGPITVSDLDGDGHSEIFAGNNLMEAGYGYIYGVDSSGNTLTGFPLRPQGMTYMNGVSIGDLDGDGDAELVSLSVTQGTCWINVFDMENGYQPSLENWDTYHGDERRLGQHRREPTLSVQGATSPGSTLRLTIMGTPGEEAYIFMSTTLSPVHLSFGWRYIGLPTRYVWIRGGALPARGYRTVEWDIPTSAWTAGVDLYFQGAIGPAGMFPALTNLVSLRL